MDNGEPQFQPQERAFYVYPRGDGVGYRAVKILELPTRPGAPYVIGTSTDPGPVLAYESELQPYDGAHDGSDVVVDIHLHPTLPPGRYRGVIVASTRPGNTDFLVQLWDQDDVEPVTASLTDITFVE